MQFEKLGTPFHSSENSPSHLLIHSAGLPGLINIDLYRVRFAYFSLTLFVFVRVDSWSVCLLVVKT
jgi:hypothetical protein